MSLIAIAVSTVWMLFGNNASTYPVAVLVLAVLLLVNSRFVADFVQSRNQTWPCYIQLVVQYCLVFSMFWTSIMAYITVPQATEYVEENWVVVQNTVLLPFTTLLDQKAYIQTYGLATMVVGLLVALSNAEPLSEAWASVGGTMRLVQGRFPIVLPEALVLLVGGALTLYFDEKAATLGVYALPVSTAALVWQSACAGLALIAILVLLLAAAKWGSTIGFHVLAVVLMLPLAFITLVTACVTLSRAGGVQDYVTSNWDSGAHVQQFVGPAFSSLPAEKYALASYTPMVAAGATGLMLTMLLWGSMLVHLRCTAILFHAGPELYALATNTAAAGVAESDEGVGSGVGAAGAMTVGVLSPLAVHKPNALRSPLGGYGTLSSGSSFSPSATVTCGLHGGPAPSASGLETPKGVAVMEMTGQGLHHAAGGGTAAPLLAGGGADAFARASERGAAGLSSSMFGRTGSDAYSGAPSPSLAPGGAAGGGLAYQQSALGAASPSAPRDGEDAAGGGAGLLGGHDDKGSLHGSEYDPIPLDEQHAAVPVGGGGGIGGGHHRHHSSSAGSGRSSLPAGLLFPITRGTSRSVADISSMIGRALPADVDTSGYKAAMAAATSAYAEYLAAHGVSVVPLRKAYREKELSTRVRMPPLRALCAAWRGDLAYMWAQTRWCIVLTALAALAAVIGMGVGIGRVAAAGTCGVLIRQPASVTYTTWFTVAPQHNVYITNDYPFGSVDVEATHIGGVLFAQNHNFTIQMTYYAASASALPSYEAFLAALNTTTPQGGDDDPTAWDYTAIRLAPPAAAVDASATDPARCVGAALKIVSNARQMVYSIEAATVLVAVNGNFADLGGDLLSAFPAFQEIDIATTAAPVLLSGVWIEGVDGDPPARNDPHFYLRPHLTVSSVSGDVTLKTVTAPGITVSTGGNIRSSTVASSLIHYCGAAVCGDITYTATGSGRIAVSQFFGGYNIKLATDSGVIVGANSGLLVGLRLDVSSQSGAIYLTNFLQAAGNETTISTHGADISISALVANRAIVSTDGAGKVSVVEGFLGATTPAAGSSSLIIPYLSTNYSLPLLHITTERGDIGVLGVGNSPTSGAFSKVASLDLRSGLGDVKVEVNGDGIAANYTLVSDRGREVAEINGVAAPPTGTLGTGSSGLNYVYLYSEGGDVQLSQLDSPY